MTDYSQQATFIKLTRPALERAAARLRPSRVRISRAAAGARVYNVLGRGGAYVVTLSTPRPDLELGRCTCPRFCCDNFERCNILGRLFLISPYIIRSGKFSQRDLFFYSILSSSLEH